MPKERNKAACNYGFTVDELKERKGLKQFFGFKDSIKLIRLSEEHTITFKEGYRRDARKPNNVIKDYGKYHHKGGSVGAAEKV